MNKSRLMIIMDNDAWTQAALHLVCAMSRRNVSSVLLLKMIAVQHPKLLGTSAGLLNYSDDDAQGLLEMLATAEDYGVSAKVHLFQYANYWSGLVDAASQLAVTAVVARISPSPIPYWQAYRQWWLRRRLARQQQLFFALEELKPSLVWTPSITLQNDMARMLEQHQS